MCTIAGIYQTQILGTPFFFLFDATGQWFAALNRMDLLNNPTAGGTYTYANGQFTINDTGMTGCQPAQTGVYSVAFTAGCANFTLTLVMDPCTGRGTALNGATFSP